MQGELAYHVEEGCVGEEGSSPVYARMDAKFKVGGRGTSDADDGLHGGIKMQELGQLIQKMLYRNANSVKAARPSINSRARYRPAV